MHEGSITIRLPVEVHEIERLNVFARKFGELHEVPSRALDAVNLALDEVVTNTILYGYDEPAGKKFQVRIWLTDAELTAELVDDGREFNPLDVPAPDINAPLSERQPGGLGLYLARSLMDRFDYRREGPKNILTLAKRIR